jgi:hypothetical protein
MYCRYGCHEAAKSKILDSIRGRGTALVPFQSCGDPSWPLLAGIAYTRSSVLSQGKRFRKAAVKSHCSDHPGSTTPSSAYKEG